MEKAHSFAIKCALNEIEKASSGLTSNFAFKDEKIIAKGSSLSEENASQTAKIFHEISEKAKPLDKLEKINIQSAEGKVSIINVDDFYVTTVLTLEADEEKVNTLTRTIIPIVKKIVEEIQPASPEIENAIPIQPEPIEKEISEENVTEIENNEEKQSELVEEENAAVYLDEKESVEPEIEEEPLLPEPPVTQLIVEHLGGLLTPSDTIRTDQEIINQWNDLYGDKEIKAVEIEALNGKTTRCKFRQIRKSKDVGRGIVKMPEKIQKALETTQGELITIKPVVE